MSNNTDSKSTDLIDRKIIEATQAGLPLTEQPYHVIAKKIGSTAETVMARMKSMLESGIIRRIGIVPNHYALGWAFNGMTVWDISDESVDRLGEIIGKLDFVSHCYRRPRIHPDWPYNLFAMIHAKDKIEADHKVAEISRLLGTDCRSHDTLYSTRILKKTGLRI